MSTPDTQTPAAAPPAPLGSRLPPNSIGAILLAAGRIDGSKLERIAKLQQEKGMTFGAAGLDLRYITQEDIDFALSKQFGYSYLQKSDAKLSPELVSGYKPFSDVGEQFRALRSQLNLRWFNAATPQRTLAIVSAVPGEGKSFVIANLAVVFAQQGQKTLLIDGDLRTTRQEQIFKTARSPGLAGWLSGRGGPECVVPVPGLNGLSLLPAGPRAPNPQELLGRPAFASLLMDLAEQHEVVLVDTPQSQRYADAEILAARATGALIVARKNLGAVHRMEALAKRLHESGVVVVGAVFNEG